MKSKQNVSSQKFIPGHTDNELDFLPFKISDLSFYEKADTLSKLDLLKKKRILLYPQHQL